MKYVIFIGDGMADLPIEALGGKTPLAHLAPRGMARLASCEIGRVRTCPEGFPPGSDVAFLTLLGNDTKKVYAGRSTLEAAGMDVKVGVGEVAFRLNLVSITEDGRILSHHGGGIEGEEAGFLVAAVKRDATFSALMEEYSLSVYATDTFRQQGVMAGDRREFSDLTPPHDITGKHYAPYLTNPFAVHLLEVSHAALKENPVNLSRVQRGLLPANALWCWGAGGAYALENFTEKYGAKGYAVSAVPLVKGIAKLSGLTAPDIPGATGMLDTNYEGKVRCALSALESGYDCALIHLEAPDEMSHDGSLENKLESIRRFDERIVLPMLKALDAMGEYRALLMPDHYTLLSTRTHDGTPVPYAIFDSRKEGVPRPFTEALCKDEPILESGDALMRALFRN